MAVSSAQLVTYPNGAVVPADEPAVAAAKVAHAAAGGIVNPVLPYAGLPYAYAAGYPYAYAYGGLVAHANGAVVPADTAEVAAAKAEFAAAGGVVAPSAPLAYAAGLNYAYAGLPYVAGLPYAGLVAHPNGAVVPVEPADVVAARNEHLAAHAAA